VGKGSINLLEESVDSKKYGLREKMAERGRSSPLAKAIQYAQDGAHTTGRLPIGCRGRAFVCAKHKGSLIPCQEKEIKKTEKKHLAPDGHEEDENRKNKI